MALYLGGVKIATGGDGTAIVSCDSYDDYVRKLNSGEYPEGTAYATPDATPDAHSRFEKWTFTLEDGRTVDKVVCLSATS